MKSGCYSVCVQSYIQRHCVDFSGFENSSPVQQEGEERHEANNRQNDELSADRDLFALLQAARHVAAPFHSVIALHVGCEQPWYALSFLSPCCIIAVPLFPFLCV